MNTRILTYIIFGLLAVLLLFLDEWGAAVLTAALMVLTSSVDRLAAQLSRPRPGPAAAQSGPMTRSAAERHE